MLEYDDKQWRQMRHTLLGLKIFLWCYVVLTSVLFVDFLYGKYDLMVKVSECQASLSSKQNQIYD